MAPPPRVLARYAEYGALAFEVWGTILAGALIGWWLDTRLGTAPYILMAATLIAVVGGFARLIQMLRRLDRGAKP